MLLNSDHEFSESNLKSIGDKYDPTQDELVKIETPVMSLGSSSHTGAAVVQWNHVCFGVREVSKRMGLNPVHGLSRTPFDFLL
ncbi:hypothetical protein E2C01_012009 [Portunus trituberculatus]|uniref:Uncharacterized protein n=1 Tax=Portunus trituberculatus TaxID=210409 RepID=A0A5B7DCJ8_PORTR|nr:hypothetical protein [Portunus trituberculatus]